MRTAVLVLSMLGAGCTNIPALDGVEDAGVDQAGYPALVPLDTLLVPRTSQIPEDLQDRITGRAEALQARAERLGRDTVIDDDTRTRMQDGVAAR